MSMRREYTEVRGYTLKGSVDEVCSTLKAHVKAKVPQEYQASAQVHFTYGSEDGEDESKLLQAEADATEAIWGALESLRATVERLTEDMSKEDFERQIEAIFEGNTEELKDEILAALIEFADKGYDRAIELIRNF